MLLLQAELCSWYNSTCSWYNSAEHSPLFMLLEQAAHGSQRSTARDCFLLVARRGVAAWAASVGPAATGPPPLHVCVASLNCTYVSLAGICCVT